MAPLVACAYCNVHALVSEHTCPHCGLALRQADGSIPRTAAAVMLGLTVATGAMGCGGSEPVPKYGVPATSTVSRPAETPAESPTKTEGQGTANGGADGAQSEGAGGMGAGE